VAWVEEEHIEHNCTLNGSDVTHCTPDFFCREHLGFFNEPFIRNTKHFNDISFRLTLI
jgi:hypothetical protein